MNSYQISKDSRDIYVKSGIVPSGIEHRDQIMRDVHELLDRYIGCDYPATLVLLYAQRAERFNEYLMRLDKTVTVGRKATDQDISERVNRILNNCLKELLPIVESLDAKLEVMLDDQDQDN